MKTTLLIIHLFATGTTYLTLVSAINNNESKDPRFQFSLRSNLKIPGGSISSSMTTVSGTNRPFLASNEDNENDALNSDNRMESTTSTTQKSKDPFVRFQKKKGRIIFHVVDSFDSTTSTANESLSISLDPFAAIRLMTLLGLAFKSFFGAFVGTLKLLGPLIFARRVLAQVGELVTDYMMGRYLRRTYDHLERKYWKEYQGPAACRSFARCLIHTLALLWLGRLMEWMVGLSHPPCVIDQKGTCHWWCGLLWIVAVIGAGNLFSALISMRGPLQVKMTKSAQMSSSSLTQQQQLQQQHPHSKNRRRRFRLKLIARPLRWMRDPDRWITTIATSRRDAWKQPFTPEPLLFPSTWPPLSILRNIAVAKAMASSSHIAVRNSMHVLMRQFLIQQAILDEWHRVLMDERRVGLGIAAIAVGFIASCFLFVTVAYADGISAVLMVPFLLATFSSGWMNLFVFWDRRRRDLARQNWIVLKNPTKRLGATSYSVKW
jgi:tryptophan-rich sensory protein